MAVDASSSNHILPTSVFRRDRISKSFATSPRSTRWHAIGPPGHFQDTLELLRIKKSPPTPKGGRLKSREETSRRLGRDSGRFRSRVLRSTETFRCLVLYQPRTGGPNTFHPSSANKIKCNNAPPPAAYTPPTKPPKMASMNNNHSSMMIQKMRPRVIGSFLRSRHRHR
jgi:hypothetical protein